MGQVLEAMVLKDRNLRPTLKQVEQRVLTLLQGESEGFEDILDEGEYDDEEGREYGGEERREYEDEEGR